jgi:serine/threonine-protein kinase HipA
MSRALRVWWDGACVGQLILDEHGDLGFSYEPDWLADAKRPAISVALPKRDEPYGRRAARAFFSGLLPEESQREGAARALGVSKSNDFRLLEELGGDVAGALTLWPADEEPPAAQGLTASRPVSDKRLLEILDILPMRPLLAGEQGLRVSLAGAQQKLPVVLVNGAVALPEPGQPSTHILKPPIAALPGSAENEAFAMRLSAALGLPTAQVELRRTANRPYLLVERYDRRVEPDGAIGRLHQEDFCQALGIQPENKYASEGGPIFKNCFDLVRRACDQPAVAVLQLLNAALFNLIVGNADAHGKNFSLLYAGGGRAMAPLYDLMCTAAYPGVHKALAMKIGKRSTLEEFTADTLADFAKEIGVGAPYLVRTACSMAEASRGAAPRVAGEIAAAGFQAQWLQELAEIVQGRAERVLELTAKHQGPG